MSIWSVDPSVPNQNASTWVRCRRCDVVAEVWNDRATVNRWYEVHRCAAPDLCQECGYAPVGGPCPLDPPCGASENAITVNRPADTGGDTVAVRWLDNDSDSEGEG